MILRSTLLYFVFSFISLSLAYSNSQYERFIKEDSLYHTVNVSSLGFSIKVYADTQEIASNVSRQAQAAIISLSQNYPVPSDARCRDRPLEIFVLDRETLNNREITPFLRHENWPRGINGVFTNTTSGDQTLSLFIAAMPVSSTRNQTISHEMVHFWQYTHCRQQSEEEAYRFEKII